MTINATLLFVFTNSGNTATEFRRVLTNKTLILAGVVFQVGSMAFYVGSEKVGSVIIPAVIASAAPLVASGLATIYDKEKLGVVKRIGAVVVVAGVIILNLV